MKNRQSAIFVAGLVLLTGVGMTSGAHASIKPVLPVSKNPIINHSTAPGITITSAKVQDNVDPTTGKSIPDRLLIQVKNGSSKVASGFEVFYTMKDSVTKASESYYQKLTGFKVKPGATSYLYFDGLSGAGHFPENKFSIYRSSTNEVRFSILLSAKGFKVASASAVKDKGTGEKVD